jgi:RHS repeat-associated protein
LAGGLLADGLGYTGHDMDADTGLTYMQQRYYDPVLARFLSVDPVSSDPSSGGNFNRYWYGGNNPYRFVDPDGRCPVNTGTRICIHAKNSDYSKSSKKTVGGTDALDKAATEKHNIVRPKFDPRNPQKIERLGSINRKSNGSLEVKLLKGVRGKQTETAETATGTPPGDAKALIHGHLDENLRDDHATAGDAGPLTTKTPLPNYAVAKDGRIMIHEIVEGRYQVRMVSGEMTETEEMYYLEKVDERQEALFNED